MTKSFWLALGLLVLVSGVVLIMSLFSATPETLTGGAIQVISYAKEGTPLSSEVKDVDGIARLDFTATAIIKDAKLIVEPILLTRDPFLGVVYNRFQITSPDADKFSSITITLKLQEKKMQDLKLKQEDVVLYHEGTPLVTEFEKSERDYAYYTAVAPTVGQFVIGKAAPVPESLPEAVVEEALPLPAVAEEQTEPLVGKSAEQSAAEEQLSFWGRIVNFFRKLFG